MSEAFVPIVGAGAGGAVIAGHKFGYQSLEIIRQDLNVLAELRAQYDLGGSIQQALQHDAVVEAYDRQPFWFDGTDFQTGFTFAVRVEVRVGDGSISVIPELWNVTDVEAAATGVACSADDADYSGSNQRQLLTFTPAAGLKEYRLRFTPSDNTYPFWGKGLIQVYAS